MSRSVGRSPPKAEKWIEGFLRGIEAKAEERTLARIRDYLARSRPLAGMPSNSLEVNWAEAHKTSPMPDAEFLDLRCEFDLRGIKPRVHSTAPLDLRTATAEAKEPEPATGRKRR